MPSPIIPEGTLKNSTEYALDSLRLTALSSWSFLYWHAHWIPKPKSKQYVEQLYSIQDRKQSYWISHDESIPNTRGDNKKLHHLIQRNFLNQSDLETHYIKT